MKNVFAVLIVLFMTSLANAQSCGPKAQYYRFWQGYKLPSMNDVDFGSGLPKFMQQTVSLYAGKGLNNYLVAIPPTQKPSFIPDEFALVAFDSENSYKTVRATPEGQVYSDSHWLYFDKSKSKSATMVAYDSKISSLESGVAYNVLNAPIDWCGGVSAFYVGLRKPKISIQTYKTRMSKHLKLTSEAYVKKGLIGYIALITDDYEVAYMNWKSEADMKKAFESKAGKDATKDASELMDPLQWSIGVDFKGAIAPNSFYSVVK